ncbi:MAG: hypothetical protein ABGY41_08375, partial [Candidatus Poribacteria bacterium]
MSRSNSAPDTAAVRSFKLALVGLLVCATGVAHVIAAGGGTVFAKAPFHSPSELLPLLDAGARVRHLSS